MVPRSFCAERMDVKKRMQTEIVATRIGASQSSEGVTSRWLKLGPMLSLLGAGRKRQARGRQVARRQADLSRIQPHGPAGSLEFAGRRLGREDAGHDGE